MSKDLSRPVRPGDVVRASLLTARREAIVRAGASRAGGGVYARSGGGLSADGDGRFCLKLTSSATGTKYAWKEVVPSPTGLWVDTGVVGSVSSDPAYEANAATGLISSDTVYEGVRAETTGEVLFRASLCDPDHDGWVALPGCNCNPVPPTITMTSHDESCNFGLFKSCVLTYGPTPPEFLYFLIGDNNHISDVFVDEVYGYSEEFVYILRCFGDAFGVERFFFASHLSSPPGGIFRELVTYVWHIADSPNSCDPFTMTEGEIFFGGDPACDVDLSE